MSKKLALIIGNSEYENSSLSRLVTPDADVNALAEILRDPQVGAFDEVKALVNEPTTTVRRAISAFFVERGQDDLLLLYFSGHGIRDDRGQLFLAVRDTELNLLRGTAIPANFITEEMDNSRSRRQVLILDCCHSGAFSHGMKAAAGESVGTATAFEGTGSGRVVLTATDSTQYAWEGDQVVGQADNSVFTHYLIQGLRSGEADTDADGRITLDELYNYVYEQVVEKTPMQTPGKWSYGQRGEIVVARNPRPVVKPVELPSDLQQTVDDPRPWVREGAVQELDRILHGSSKGLALSALAALKRLAEDDSRRVAGTAARSLAAYAGTQPAPESTVAVPQAPAAAGEPKEQPAIAQAEIQSIPREKAATVDQPAIAGEPAKTEPSAIAGQPSIVDQPPMVEQPVIAEQPITAEQPPRAEPSASVEQPAGDGQTAAREIQPEVVQPAVKTGPAIPSMDPRLLLIVWTTLGWAVGFALASYISSLSDSPFVGVIDGAFGGLTIGLVWRQTEVDLHWPQILIISLGWIISFMLSWGANSPVIGVMGAIGWDISSPNAAPIVGAITGILGGLITGLVLRWANGSIRWKKVLWITIGWSISGYIALSVYASLISHVNSTFRLLFLGALTGACGGAIGSVVLYWQNRQVAKPAGGPEAPTAQNGPEMHVRSAVRQAKRNQPVPEQNEVNPKQPPAAIDRILPRLKMIRLPLLWMILGWTLLWAFGWVNGESQGWSGSNYDNSWTILGAAGGLITGLALQRIKPSIHWVQILLITLGWTLGVMAGGFVSQALYQSDNTAINGTVHGVIGGLVTALVVQWTERRVRWKQILIITLGWTIGWTIHQAIAPGLYNSFQGIFSNGIIGWFLPGAIVGLISAVIGSVVMFWQLGQFDRSVPGQTRSPTLPPAGND